MYLSKVNTAKRVAGYAGSLSELGGKSSLPSPDNVAKGSKELPRSSADPNAGAAGFAPAQGTAFPKGQEIPKYVSVETLRQVFEACQGLVSQANAELDGRNAGSHAAEESACAVLASEFAAAENLEALSHWVVSTDVIGVSF